MDYTVHARALLEALAVYNGCTVPLCQLTRPILVFGHRLKLARKMASEGLLELTYQPRPPGPGPGSKSRRPGQTPMLKITPQGHAFLAQERQNADA